MIKTVLAITNGPGKRPGPYHIVTQIRNSRNLPVVEMVAAHHRVEAIWTYDFIARIVAQTSRQSGLSVVYTELMNFSGDEIYYKNEPQLVGKTYGEALFAYEDSCLMGLRKADGKILVNPPMDTRIQAGDHIFAISEDDGTVLLSNIQPQVDVAAIVKKTSIGKPQPEKCLILGWNNNGLTILNELSQYMAKGSQITVAANIEGLESQVRERLGEMPNVKLKLVKGDTTDRDVLNRLHPENQDHVIVLPYASLGPQEADAKTLITVLHLRDIAGSDESPFSIVSEMLDLHNRELAQAARVDDFIVSDQLLSLVMAQFSEDAELFEVFADIFDPQGCEIYLKPIGGYVVTGRPVNFYTVLEAARRRGETAIGYRLAAESNDAEQSYGVHTNPKKSAGITFSTGDKLIVLAEK